MTIHFSPEQYKKVAEYIERKVLKTKDRSAILLGVVFLSISLSAFLFSTSTREPGCATGYELIFHSHQILPAVFALLHLFAIVFLLFPNFPDKFQFATAFTIINISLLFIFMTEGSKGKGLACQAGVPSTVISFFALMFCWLNCGIKAHCRESRLGIFKFVGRINAWIQKKYDES